MRVLLVTTWDTACGIAEHSWYLREAVEAADRSITLGPSPEALDPSHPVITERGTVHDIIHLNYHAALHSRWTADHIRVLRAEGQKVIVTYHDTGVPNSDQCRSICAAADAFVVHEPYDDLTGNGRYWRMGVPDWPRLSYLYDTSPGSWCGARPILGSLGFPFPWKNFDLLARLTGELDWALLLIAPTATPEQIAGWRRLNPHLWVDDKFLPRDIALARLAACDATAFPYVCANTGQSGAILQGIAARKPVIAFGTNICRQFRALGLDPLGQETIRWAQSEADLRRHLRTVPIGRVDPGMVALAQQDGWAGLGRRYAALYREVADAA